jgi:hypothetical protein
VPIGKGKVDLRRATSVTQLSSQPGAVHLVWWRLGLFAAFDRQQ